ncbi:hypothetical protein VN97_g2051 [Penicillium thymicola]|uniref:Uncharacterized protein n=1 Tax=Penicillium thymicola TaxID=293382 RepID=A0AAI9XCK9_PENTH|nr:hypothetical protein VN97_g2051 [Penicillium thymicola]
MKGKSKQFRSFPPESGVKNNALCKRSAWGFPRSWTSELLLRLFSLFLLFSFTFVFLFYFDLLGFHLFP